METETENKKSKEDRIRDVVRYYLTRPFVRAKDVTKDLDLTKRQTFRYLDEVRPQLRPSEEFDGAFVYVPSEDEIEMSVLTLKRAIAEGQLNDEIIELAQEVIQQASRTA